MLQIAGEPEIARRRQREGCVDLHFPTRYFRRGSRKNEFTAFSNEQVTPVRAPGALPQNSCNDSGGIISADGLVDRSHRHPATFGHVPKIVRAELRLDFPANENTAVMGKCACRFAVFVGPGVGQRFAIITKDMKVGLDLAFAMHKPRDKPITAVMDVNRFTGAIWIVGWNKFPRRL